MALFLVSQEPRTTYRQSHVILICVVEAETKAAAMLKSRAEAGNDIYKAPKAEKLELGVNYRF